MVVFPIIYRGCLPSINSFTSETSHPAGSHNAAFFVTCVGRGGGGRVEKYPTLAAQTTSESGAKGWGYYLEEHPRTCKWFMQEVTSQLQLD